MNECQATPSDQLEKEIMSACVPKSEREWWAMRKIESLILKCEQLQTENEEFKKLHVFLFPRQSYKTTLRTNFTELIQKLQRIVVCAEALDIPALITAIEHATDNILLMGQVALLNELQHEIAIKDAE